MTECSHQSDENRIEKVSRERNKGCSESIHQVGEVIQGRVSYEKPRRIQEKFIERLERIGNRKNQRHGTEDAEQAKEEEESDVSAQRTVQSLLFLGTAMHLQLAYFRKRSGIDMAAANGI